MLVDNDNEDWWTEIAFGTEVVSFPMSSTWWRMLCPISGFLNTWVYKSNFLNPLWWGVWGLITQGHVHTMPIIPMKTEKFSQSSGDLSTWHQTSGWLSVSSPHWDGVMQLQNLLFKISNIARYIQFYIACWKREHRSISFISSLGNICKKTDMWLLTLKNSEPRGKSKADYDECPNERTKEFKAKMNSESFQGFKDEVAFDQDFILKQNRGRCSQWKRKSVVWFM